MKNLILTTGILLLFVMGTLYQLDCAQAIRFARRLDWTCKEMAEALTREEDGAAKAQEILQRNMEGWASSLPAWSSTADSSGVTVRMEAEGPPMRLSFLRGLVRLSASGHAAAPG